MKRSVVDARLDLQEMLPRLSDYHANVRRQQVEAAEAHARTQADEHTATQAAWVTTARTDALRELTDVCDALDELAAQGANGRLSASTYTAQLRALQARQASAEAQLAEAARRTDQVATIEDDPLRWFSDLQRRFPHLQEDYEW
jgi:hypothetical protein